MGRPAGHGDFGLARSGPWGQLGVAHFVSEAPSGGEDLSGRFSEEDLQRGSAVARGGASQWSPWSGTVALVRGRPRAHRCWRLRAGSSLVPARHGGRSEYPRPTGAGRSGSRPSRRTWSGDSSSLGHFVGASVPLASRARSSLSTSPAASHRSLLFLPFTPEAEPLLSAMRAGINFPCVAVSWGPHSAVLRGYSVTVRP